MPPSADADRLGLGRALTLAAGTAVAIGVSDARAGWVSARSAPTEQLRWCLALAVGFFFALWLTGWLVSAPLRRRLVADGPASLSLSLALFGAWAGLYEVRSRPGWIHPLDLALPLLPAILPVAAVLAVWGRRRPSADSAWRAHLAALGVFAVALPAWVVTFDLAAEPRVAATAALALALVLLGSARWARTAPALSAGSALVWLAFSCALTSPLWAPGPAPPAERPAPPAGAPPTVVLVVVDTLRQDALSCLSGGDPQTPHVDALAAESTVYEKARAPSSWTLPSTVSILTGQHPRVHGVVDIRHGLPRGLPTLSERLSAAGYRTAAFGENGWLTPRTGLARGFDLYDFHPRYLAEAPVGAPLVRRVLPGRFRDALPAPALTGRALRWLSRQGDAPAFVWLHYFDVHQPYEPAPAFRPPGPPADGVGWSFGDITGVRQGHFAPDPAQRAWIHALYQGEVRQLDHELGHLFDGLRDLGRYQDALVIVTSDHGEEFWEHGGYEHGHTLYDELLRVPLLVRHPRGASPGRVARPVSIEAVAASVLEACGLEHGSAHPPLSQPESGPLVASDNHYYAPQVALVDHGWKYVRNEYDGSEELYDLAADPREQRSLVQLEPARSTRLRELLDERLRVYAELRRAAGDEASTNAPDQDELRALRALGYVR